MPSVVAALSVALAVSGLGAAERASAHASSLQALASASTSSGRALLPSVPAHPARAVAAAHPHVVPAPPPPPPPAAPTAAPAPPGPTPVGTLSLPLVDTSRQARSGPRVLTTTVWYPAAPGSPDNATDPPASGGPFPLIVFAPGYNATPASYAALLRGWAQSGYVVAAPTFPLTNPGALGGPDEGDVVNQWADVRFVIDQLVAQGKPGPFAHLIDPRKIAVAGHSDGGITAAEVAYNTCCRDPRISAAVIMAGAEIGVPGGSYFPPGSPPMLVIQGDADHSNNPQNSRQLYDNDGGGPRYLLDLPGASHEGPFMSTSPPANVVDQASLDFLDHYLKGHPGTEQLLRDSSFLGVASILAPPGQS